MELFRWWGCDHFHWEVVVVVNISFGVPKPENHSDSQMIGQTLVSVTLEEEQGRVRNSIYMECVSV